MENGVTFDSTIEELQAALEEVNAAFGELEEQEPKNESSGEHKEWESRCDELALMSETLMTWIDQKMTKAQGLV